MNKNRNHYYFHYLLCVVILFIICCLVIVYLADKVGFGELLNRLLPYRLLPYRYRYTTVIYLPKEILRELERLDGYIENASIPIKRRQHNTILVMPDRDLGYVLRSNVKINAYMMKTRQRFNFDPPLIYLRSDYNEHSSKKLKDYLDKYTRYKYSYSTNKIGMRRTVPEVISDEAILIVGDSVAFGVGVNDEDTIASYLQRLAGSRFQIENSAVGGYGYRETFLTAKKLSQDKKYFGLVYIVCQNDFSDSDYVDKVENAIKMFASIKDSFNNKVIIFLHTYMEYCLFDVFLNTKWNKCADFLRNELPRLCEKYGLIFSDWTVIADDYQREIGSEFSKFALYSDHCHLSPLGNRLVAEKLWQILMD